MACETYLKTLLSGKSLEIIDYFMSRPNEEITRGKVVNDLELSKATAVKYLDLLLETGILSQRLIGNNKLMHLNNDSGIAREIKKLSIMVNEKTEKNRALLKPADGRKNIM